MMVDLNQDQKQKLKRLFENQNYSKFESQIEKLGSIEDLPIYLKMGYAGSKVLNPNSKKNDFLNFHFSGNRIFLSLSQDQL